ncbi:MAG TPA: MarR family winged helix-turn-helix transcriptional regulator [Rhodanobacteraceae bacterium]|nr:MarR family winged helix-turn-helix transcriptional regulator [Rhodanobacteraceae bacterium]
MPADASLFETTRCLCLAARRAARAITREFDQALRPCGLRATQFTLLAALRLAGPQAIGALAELLSSDRTTLTRNLAVLERRGWVTFKDDSDDARIRIATVTTRGAHALTAALPAWRATQQRLTAEIGTQTAASLRKLAGGPCVLPCPPAPT